MKLSRNSPFPERRRPVGQWRGRFLVLPLPHVNAVTTSKIWTDAAFRPLKTLAYFLHCQKITHSHPKIRGWRRRYAPIAYLDRFSRFCSTTVSRRGRLVGLRAQKRPQGAQMPNLPSPAPARQTACKALLRKPTPSLMANCGVCVSHLNIGEVHLLSHCDISLSPAQI